MRYLILITTLFAWTANASDLTHSFKNPAFIIVSGWLSQDGENIINGITEGFGNNATIFGGMAGDDLILEGPMVFSNHTRSDKGLLALIIDQDKIDKMGFSDVQVQSIGRIPIHAPFRQQAALARFRHLKLEKKYDYYIIDGDWAVSAAVHHKPSLWYVHSPIRER